ncbi:MAG TPA: hypothetical protein VIL20_18385 [Sandaracinaceae bacterium]
MKKTLTGVLAVVALTLSACGGGDYQPVDQTHTGVLTDADLQHSGRTCDAYEVSVGRGWRITAEMTSDWDNYLYLAKGFDVESNDDTNGTNARIDTNVDLAGVYTIYACAFSSGRGPYTLRITTRAGS